MKRLEGVVTRVQGHHYDVETLEGHIVCHVRGRMKLTADGSPVVTGDRVYVERADDGAGVIVEVTPRTRALTRKHPGRGRAREDILLANPDQALFVFAAAHPKPHLRMLDRFIATAEAGELPVLICVNKLDLASRERAEELFGLYTEIGYPVFYMSAITGEGVDALRKALRDQITVVAGPSGVGKSRLLNAIEPGLNLPVGEVSRALNKGRHTTNTAWLLPLSVGGYVADTPGVREVGLWDLDPLELDYYYREFRPFLGACRYNDCLHVHEPDCSVRAAVTTGHIRPERYNSYLRLLDEIQ